MEKKALIAAVGLSFTLGGAKNTYDNKYKKPDPLGDKIKANRE